MDDDRQQRCGGCKRVLPIGAFSPSYWGKTGTWCRACFAANARGERDTTAHEPQKCSHCGSSYVPRRLAANAAYCSRRCKGLARNAAASAAREASKPVERTCMHCGEPMPQRMRSDAVFCSAECNYRAHALQRKLRARTGEEGKPGFLRAFIAERDRWRCGICGKRVNRKLRHPDPLCPSLDHVIPVSEGGTNDVWNLRLTHLRCNLSRRNRGGGEQLAML